MPARMLIRLTIFAALATLGFHFGFNYAVQEAKRPALPAVHGQQRSVHFSNDVTYNLSDDGWMFIENTCGVPVACEWTRGSITLMPNATFGSFTTEMPGLQCRRSTP